MDVYALLWNKNVWGLFIVLVFIIFGLISIIFAYHWKRFGDDLPIIKLGSVLYIVGSAIIVTAIFIVFETLP